MHDATDFWLLAGTAAPVIALANVVSYGDSAKLALDFKAILKHSAATSEQKKWAKNGYTSANLAMAIGYVNLALQSLAFLSALLFFAIGNGTPPLLLVLILTYGMIAIFAGSFFQAVRNMLQPR